MHIIIRSWYGGPFVSKFKKSIQEKVHSRCRNHSRLQKLSFKMQKSFKTEKHSRCRTIQDCKNIHSRCRTIQDCKKNSFKMQNHSRFHSRCRTIQDCKKNSFEMQKPFKIAKTFIRDSETIQDWKAFKIQVSSTSARAPSRPGHRSALPCGLVPRLKSVGESVNRNKCKNLSVRTTYVSCSAFLEQIYLTLLRQTLSIASSCASTSPYTLIYHPLLATWNNLPTAHAHKPAAQHGC